MKMVKISMLIIIIDGIKLKVFIVILRLIRESNVSKVN